MPLQATLNIKTTQGRDTETAVKKEVTLCKGEQHCSSIEPVRIMQNFVHTSSYS